MTRTRTTLVVAALGLAFGLGGCGGGDDVYNSLFPVPEPGPAPTAPATEPGEDEGYSREAFLPRGWPNHPDRLGADLRHELLVERNLDDVRRVEVVQGRVASGAWSDPYTGRVVTSPKAVQIDHVFSLSDAWDSGAREWNPALRFRFATDPDNLVITELNSEKQDSLPGTWDDELLTREGLCFNVERYESVQVRYSLVLTPEEQQYQDTLRKECRQGSGWDPERGVNQAHRTDRVDR